MMSVKRRLFTILSAVSLVLCLATAGAWVRSYCSGGWQWPSEDGMVCCTLARGRVCIRRSAEVSAPMPGDRLLSRMGFEYGRTSDPAFPGLRPTISESLIFPCWLPFALTALLPALWLWRYRRDRRLRSDGMPHCAKCDYNLTGNVSGVCPECGTPIPGDLIRTDDAPRAKRRRRATA